MWDPFNRYIAVNHHPVKAMVSELSCTMWNLDHKGGWSRRIDASELCCWRRLLRVPWTARRSNQSVLKEISPEYSLEGQTLKLKLQCFGHLLWRADSLEKTLKAGEVGNRGWSAWVASPTQWPWAWANPGDSEGQGSLVCLGSWGHKESVTT